MSFYNNINNIYRVTIDDFLEFRKDSGWMWCNAYNFLNKICILSEQGRDYIFIPKYTSYSGVPQCYRCIFRERDKLGRPKGTCFLRVNCRDIQEIACPNAQHFYFKEVV